MMQIKFLILVAFIGFAAAVPVEDKEDEKCSVDNLNECSSQLLEYALDENYPVPETEDDVRGHCSNIKNASKCIKSYFKDCTSESTRQMARVISSGVKKRINKGCSARGIREILKHTECMRAVRGPLKLCYKQGVKDMYSIKNAEKKHWHPLTCCFGSKGYECALNAVRKNCEGDSVDYFVKESTQLVTELTETFCPTDLVWGRRECSKIVIDLPEAMIPKDKKVTILPLLLDVIQEFSIDEEDL